MSSGSCRLLNFGLSVLSSGPTFFHKLLVELLLSLKICWQEDYSACLTHAFYFSRYSLFTMDLETDGLAILRRCICFNARYLYGHLWFPRFICVTFSWQLYQLTNTRSKTYWTIFKIATLVVVGMTPIYTKTLSNGNIFRVHDDVIKWKHFPRYWPFVEFTGPRWISRSQASDVELWCFLWYTPEEMVE